MNDVKVDNKVPFYKKVLKHIKKIHINYTVLISILVIGLLVLILWGLTIANQVDVPKRKPYDKTGFIAKKDYQESEITLENSRFKFAMDTDTTHFILMDSVTGKTWRSYPQGEINDMPNSVQELFILYYERTLENPQAMKVNGESIKYDNYAFRVDDDSIEVLYTVGGKHETTIDDLPKKISVKKMEDKILPKLNELAQSDSSIRRSLKFFTSQYLLYEGDGETYYYLRSVDSSDGIQILYDLLFVYGGYTEEDFKEDGEKFGFDTNPPIPVFEFSVKYTITDNGFDFRLINDSLFEVEEYPIAYIDILPYFGSGNIDSQGYIVIPDGSGILIDFNNNKYNSTPYNKRIYGNDYAITSTNAKLVSEYEDIALPMYGINCDGSSFINAIEQGAAMTSINAGFKTEYSNNTLKHKFPYANYRYYIRERDAYTFTGLGSDQKVNVWTDYYNTEDFVSKFMFLANDDQSYVGMAKLYKEYLLDNGILTSDGDKTKEAILNLTLLGGYKTTEHFLGIPYETVKSLTSVEQAKIIVDKLISEEVDNINLSYQGWANNGIKPEYMNDIKFNNVVGSKKEFIAFAQYLSDKNVNFIPEVYVNTAFTDENIKVKRDVISDMFWNKVTRYDFNLATMLPDTDTIPIYPIVSSKADSFMKNIEKLFSEYGFSSIGFIDHGNNLNSSFDKKNVIFKNDSLDYFNESLKNTSGSFKEVMIRNPFMYAFSSMTYALDVPTRGTDYKIINYSIPFVQLVLNGCIDYSANAFNVDDSYSLDWHKLKAIETGSNLNFVWSYENTVELTQTEFNEFYSTHYENWFEDTVSIYHELNDLGFYSSTLTKHEILNNKGTLIKVTYNNGLSVLINYDDLTYEVLKEVEV